MNDSAPEASRASLNGADHGRGAQPIVWSPGVMLASELDADVDEAVYGVVEGNAWKAFRFFRNRFGIELNPETMFSELDAVWPPVWEACGLTPPSAREVAEFAAEYAHPLSDPQTIGQELERARARRFQEHNRADRELKPEGVSPKAHFSLAEVERVLGVDVADTARSLIDRANLRAWEAPPPRPKERSYLVSAGELYRHLCVSAGDIAQLTPPTDDDRDAALLMLARARKLHRDSISSPDDAGVPLAQAIRHVVDMAGDAPTGVIVGGLVYEEMVIHWIGDGGTYKTFTVLDLACSVAAGRNVTCRLTVPNRVGVLYLCAERRHHGLNGDVQAWCQHNGISLDRDSLALHGWDDVVQLVNPKRMRELTQYVVDNGIKLIVVDTQSMATIGLEENSATAMNTALTNAKALARRAKAAVIVIHHTARGQNTARGSTVWRDNTDATVRQTVTGLNEGEFVIDKHKSVESGTRFPVKVQPVTVTAPVGDGRGFAIGERTFTTLVAGVRDPLSVDERAERVRATLSDDDKILVAVVTDNDGPPLSPAEVQRRAAERGCTLKKDATAQHLQKLARPGYGCVVETVDPMSKRKTYGARASSSTLDGGRTR